VTQTSVPKKANKSSRRAVVKSQSKVEDPTDWTSKEKELKNQLKEKQDLTRSLQSQLDKALHDSKEQVSAVKELATCKAELEEKVCKLDLQQQELMQKVEDIGIREKFAADRILHLKAKLKMAREKLESASEARPLEAYSDEVKIVPLRTTQPGQLIYTSMCCNCTCCD
jgi:predicted nuclease with TOPRIM domain